MHPNEKLIRKVVERFQAGDVKGLLGLLTDDIAVHVAPGHQLSGEYKGGQDFAEKFLGRVMQITGGVELELHDVLASDDHAVGLYTIRARRKGTEYEWLHVNVYHVRDGKVAEFWWTPFDQKQVSALLAK